MKQIPFFVIALLISGCDSVPTTKSQPSPPVITQPVISQPEIESSPTDNPKQALVIGNSEYEYSPLVNPTSDAGDMAAKLRQMGFAVTFKTNLDYQTMDIAIHDFGKRLLDTQAKDSVGLFYFAGHGARSSSDNYLLPINNRNIKNESDLQQNALHAKIVLARMEEVNKGMNIIILDACRDNPYSGVRTLSRGLTRMPPPVGALIAFATEEGKTAADSDDSAGRNGLYTKHLLAALEGAEHKRIEDVFMQVRNSVQEDSKRRVGRATAKPTFQ